MPTTQQPLNEDAKRELNRLWACVQAHSSAARIWNRALTPNEQQRLGGKLNAAWQTAGTVGMWARLRSVSVARALMETALYLGFTDQPMANWLFHELREGRLKAPPDLTSGEARPWWNKEKRELNYAGVVVRRIPRPNQASNVVSVLDAFEEKSWPARIDDPLQGVQDPQRLHRTVKVLNEGLSGIRFHSDGTGKGISWSTI